MKKYKAIDVVRLGSGQIVLNKDQARRRDMSVGLNCIDKEICLKSGEVFEYDGNIPKSMRVQVIYKQRGRPKASKAMTT